MARSAMLRPIADDPGPAAVAVDADVAPTGPARPGPTAGAQALAGARPRSHPARVPRAAAMLALLAGVIDLVSALLPAQRERLELLNRYIPGTVSSGATVATVAAGVALILLAGGLRRRQRPAWITSVALLSGGAVLHVVKGLDVEEALVEAFLAGLLLGQGAHFVARSGHVERRSWVPPAISTIVVTLGYGSLGLLANDRDAMADTTVLRILRDVGRMAIGLGPAQPETGRFGHYFPGSVTAAFLLGALVVAGRILAPALARRPADPRLTAELEAAVGTSTDSLAYFALRADRACVREGGAMVSYREVGTVALAAGDPLGPRGEWPGAVAAFLRESAVQGRIPAVLGCGADAAVAYGSGGLATVYLGDEAVLTLDRFTLEGRRMRIVRQSWNRARRAGYTATICRSSELDATTVSALRELSRRWRGEATERGFSMALGRLFDPADPDTIVVAARDGDDRLRGFLHFVPWDGDGVSLDVMRRDREGPSWLNDFLIAEAALGLGRQGVRRMSLNFSFLRAILAAAEGQAPLRVRAAGWVLRRLSRQFPIDTLYRFNKKFDPIWRPRYLALETADELPRVAIAALRAEGLLPSVRRRLRRSGRPRR